MKHGQTIAVHQFTILVIMFGVGTSILIAPAPLVADAKQDAWLSCLLGIAAGLLPIALFHALSKHFPQKTIIEMSRFVFGKWLGTVISLLYVLFFLILSSFLLGDLGYFMTTEVMPETPILFIMACLMAVVVYAVRKGPEVIARGAEVFFPLAVFLFVVLVLMLMPITETKRLEPVLENGLKPVFTGSFYFFSLQEYVVLMMLYPYVKKSAKANPAFYIGSLVAGAALFAVVLLCILVLGPSLTAANNYPSFALAKKISIGNFFERVEVIIGALWLITITFKLILTFFASALGTCQIFQFKSYTFLTMPLGLLSLASVLPMYTNIVFISDFVHRIWPSFSFFFLVLLPMATWMMAWIRKRFSAH